MRLLIDHGTYDNLGDLAMLEGVVCRLLNTLPEAQNFVIDRGFQTMIWDLNGVSRLRDYSFETDDPNNIFRRVPVLGRAIPGINAKIKLPFLGNLSSAGSMSLANRQEASSQRMKLAEFCEAFDALHMCGGGYLTDAICMQLFRKCSLISAFAEQGKPIVLTGQQLGPFKTPFFKRALLRTLRQVNFVGIREPGGSLALCQEARLEQERFGVMGDDSFGIPVAEDPHLLGLLARYDLEASNFLAFNVRLAGRYAKGHARYLQQIAELGDKMADGLQMPVLIVPTLLTQSDIEVGKKLVELAGRKDMLVLENGNLTPAMVKGLLGKAFGAVGVSYHFCTFALNQGVPAVCIYDGSYYAQKARGLCGFWGDERLALPLKGLNIEFAVDHITQVFKDEFLRDKMRVTAKKSVERWREIFDKQVRDAFGEVC